MSHPGDGPSRQFDRRRLLRNLATGGLGVGLAGCTQSSDATTDSPTETQSPTREPTPYVEPPPQKVTVGLTSHPTDLNPLTPGSTAGELLLANFYESGVYVEPCDYDVKPWVWTDWTVENVDSGEPDVYWQVHDGLTWNDGEPFGIDDVLFTYEYLLEQEPERYADVLEPIESVAEAANDYDVHMSMSEPDPLYETRQLGGLPLLAKHVWDGIDRFEAVRVETGDSLVGLGWAHELIEYDPDSHASVIFRQPPLTEHEWIPDYHDYLIQGGPYLNEVEFRFYADESAMNAALLDGDVDTCWGSVTSEVANRVRDEARLELLEGVDGRFGVVGFDVRQPPLDDLTFRQALGMLWNEREWIGHHDRVSDGDFVVSPAYGGLRPETASDLPRFSEHGATEAFAFRTSEEGGPDVAGIRAFLETGEAVTGEGGEYVGREYPGSLTGITASQDGGKHDYTFGPAVSPVLHQEGVERELRVDGTPISESLGGPLRYLLAPSWETPGPAATFVANVRSVGIPIQREPLGEADDESQREAAWDLYHGECRVGPFGVPALSNRFGSDATDPIAPGYAGADDLIGRAVGAVDSREHARRAVERIYLDHPVFVSGYRTQQWPFDTEKFVVGLTADDRPEPDGPCVVDLRDWARDDAWLGVFLDT